MKYFNLNFTLEIVQKAQKRFFQIIHLKAYQFCPCTEGAVRFCGESKQKIGSNKKCTSMRCPWSVSPVREPPRIKTSRQQTVVATARSPQMLIIIVATNPGRTILESQNSENGAAWKFLEVLGIMVIFPNRPVTFPELSLLSFQSEKKLCNYQEVGGEEKIASI
jgi:hypothetical protein